MAQEITARTERLVLVSHPSPIFHNEEASMTKWLIIVDTAVLCPVAWSLDGFCHAPFDHPVRSYLVRA